MSETKKFTKEELEQIQSLREANALKVNEFGQLELELLLTNQRLESLDLAKKKIHEEYKNLQEEERKLVKSLNDKYGAGTVDLASGEFVPSN
jgi:lipase chaperone LimK